MHERISSIRYGFEIRSIKSRGIEIRSIKSRGFDRGRKMFDVGGNDGGMMKGTRANGIRWDRGVDKVREDR